jgi:hypothetical protein
MHSGLLPIRIRCPATLSYALFRHIGHYASDALQTDRPALTT